MVESPGPQTWKAPGDRRSKELGLHERLALIGLIDQGMQLGPTERPVAADLFSDLWDLVDTTVSGSKIDRLKPEDSRNGFRVFEIRADTGETLARLNMLYLRKPIPCYYLVYVEVVGPFRRKGLGNRILEYFRDFLIEKSALGILDNIIPKEDPTYDIYFKQAWEPVEAIVGDSVLSEGSNYMLCVPPVYQGKPIREAVLKLLHHLKRKRTVIEMRDNEVMVRRTIAEFKHLYSALLKYFEQEIRQGNSTTLMRFMFTRFVTKLIAFRRRISVLLGYTGGESLEQITLSPVITTLRAQTYTPRELAGMGSFVVGDEPLFLSLPEFLKKYPARFIESLPNYGRPSLQMWLEQRNAAADVPMTIGDLLDLGFDPTRLKEFTWDCREYIFERIQARQLRDLEDTRGLLARVDSSMCGERVGNARLRVNAPLLVIRDKGNAYVLRHKLAGIHWEEAVEQLQTAPGLRTLNSMMRIDRMIMSTVRKTRDLIDARLGAKEGSLEFLSCFVPWDLVNNRPRLIVDTAESYLETVWVA